MKLILILLFFTSFTLIAKENISSDKFGKTAADVEYGHTGKAVDADNQILPKVNPIISANFLLLYDYSQLIKADNGFKIQEVLLQFGATVDKVFEAEIFLGIEQEKDRNKFDVFPIGVFAETRTGKRFNFRGGQFLNHFGEHNSRYKHNFPFILAPLINQEIFGERGLNFIGLGADWKGLLSKHAEITFEITQGRNEHLYGDEENHYLGNLRVVGLHSIADAHSLKIGGSAGVSYQDQWIWGADFSYDHNFHPDHNFHLRFEYLGKNKEKRQGLYALAQYRFLKSWQLGYRYEYSGLEKDPIKPVNQRHTVLLAALPTYFSGVRVEYIREIMEDGKNDNRFLFQLNQTVGPRRAHSY